ncbi:sigma-70 family RNA polymerase sigma factor [Streptomyces fulvorobeus]|uniref:RNA polymerase primary sigma factor n=1 Tax=Streptomyces fulvorobeus TaxID=284028 RepID=A0A7J0CG49_9ACTN|nr:sigma-70 family RNA polymerase sigma factor [Streptomyces fulvorobeus]NYE44249.1 RNA polymerase primary sigma factor [Streptomyces fulvorobeus]GFN00765.1 hypothetical protein Sfulv_55750 [Streptomyces fulvorobeus]
MTTPASVTAEQIQAAQDGDADAMWQIVSAYEPILKSVIRSVAPAANQEDAEDLLQEARVVLIQHIREYRTEASSAQLHSFAFRAVRRAVAEEWLRSTTSLSVDPSAALTVKRVLWEEEGDVDRAFTTVSADADPRRRMSREAFVSVCEALASPIRLDTPQENVRGAVPEDGNMTMADRIPDTLSSFTDSTERRDLARYLLNEIPQRRAYALKAYYGINMQALTDAEVSTDMQVTAKAVRDLRSKGLESAREVAVRDSLRVAA